MGKVTAEAALAPVAPEERVALLDAVRGVALAGILVANLVSFTGYYVMTPAELAALPTSRWDAATVFGMHLLLEGKFYSVFSLLFGVGFALQARRAEARGADFAPLFGRRMRVLLAFGLCHIFLLWHGDILTLYALMGLALLSLRGLSDAALLRWAAVLLAARPAVHALLLIGDGALDPSQPFKALARWVQEAAGAGGRSLLSLRTSEDRAEVLLGNVVNALQRPGQYLRTSRPTQVLGMFLLGAWAGRRLLPGVERHGALLRRLLGWGLAVGLAGSAGYAVLAEITGDTFSLSGLGLVQSFAYMLGVPALALAYAAGLALLWERPGARRVLAPFVPLGRMAISNYLGQSVIGLALFYGHGLGLMGRLGAFWSLPLAAVILAAQWVASTLWLRRFGQGPVEHLWRRLTYRGEDRHAMVLERGGERC